MKERNENGPPDRRYDPPQNIWRYRNDAYPIDIRDPQTLIMNISFGIAPKDRNVTRMTTRR
jgi:hypothetical protein